MIVTPGLMAEVTTKLATGPAVDPVSVELPAGGPSRLVILWRELPQRVAAVLAVIGGVLWLMVSPTAPAAASQAVELLQNLRPGVTQVVHDAPVSPTPAVPRPRKRSVDVERTIPERRRPDDGATSSMTPVGLP